jgi:hypothetical protein
MVVVKRLPLLAVFAVVVCTLVWMGSAVGQVVPTPTNTQEIDGAICFVSGDCSKCRIKMQLDPATGRLYCFSIKCGNNGGPFDFCAIQDNPQANDKCKYSGNRLSLCNLPECTMWRCAEVANGICNVPNVAECKCAGMNGIPGAGSAAYGRPCQ